mmetsp:Transcript_34616/g.78250  ORF Transcript_34616/g.78250 Transcript_34616/m.78250 type:complete len:99 (-) Transcript_34616:345-641(-)
MRTMQVSLAPEGMPWLSTRPLAGASTPSQAKTTSALQAQAEAQAAAKAESEAAMQRLADLARQRAMYHPNGSMGSRKGVDATPVYDSDSDGGWDDEGD